MSHAITFVLIFIKMIKFVIFACHIWAIWLGCCIWWSTPDLKRFLHPLESHSTLPLLQLASWHSYHKGLCPISLSIRLLTLWTGSSVYSLLHYCPLGHLWSRGEYISDVLIFFTDPKIALHLFLVTDKYSPLLWRTRLAVWQVFCSGRVPV